MNNVQQTRAMAAGGPAGASASERTIVATPTTMPGGDPLRTQMGAVSTCPICHSTTSAIEIYCGDCGYLLSSVPTGEVEPPRTEVPAAELVDVQEGRRYTLNPGVNTIGRQGADILIQDGTVSRLHARILVLEGTVQVEDLGSTNGTKVGDQRLSPNQPVTVTHGTPVRFGNWRVVVETTEQAVAPVEAQPDSVAPRQEPPLSPADPEDSAAPEAPPVAVMRKVEGSASDIPIRTETVTIGRKAGNHVVFPQDAFVSGRHAELRTESSGIYLTDLGSTNGTRVNGLALKPDAPHLLLDGDEVQIGQSKFRFELVVIDQVDPLKSTALESFPATEAGISLHEADSPGVRAPEQDPDHGVRTMIRSALDGTGTDVRAPKQDPDLGEPPDGQAGNTAEERQENR